MASPVGITNLIEALQSPAFTERFKGAKRELARVLAIDHAARHKAESQRASMDAYSRDRGGVTHTKAVSRANSALAVAVSKPPVEIEKLTDVVVPICDRDTDGDGGCGNPRCSVCHGMSVESRLKLMFDNEKKQAAGRVHGHYILAADANDARLQKWKDAKKREAALATASARIATTRSDYESPTPPLSDADCGVMGLAKVTNKRGHTFRVGDLVAYNHYDTKERMTRFKIGRVLSIEWHSGFAEVDGGYVLKMTSGDKCGAHNAAPTTAI